MSDRIDGAAGTHASRMTAAKPSLFRKLAFLAARIVVTAALLYLAVRRVQWDLFFFNLQHMRIGFFACGIGVLVVQAALAGVRWGRIVEACGLLLGTEDAVRFTFAAAFFNQTLPASVGGDAVRSWLLRKRYSNWSAPIYSVIIDRCLGGIALALLVLATLPLAFALIAQPAARLSLALVGLGCLAIFGGILWAGALPWGLLDRIAVMKYPRAVSSIVRAPSSLRGALWIVPLSILIHLLSALCVWCMALAVSSTLTLTAALVLVPPIMLIIMVPISIAGWGVRESAMVTILAYAGVDNSKGFLVSILFGIASLIVGIIGGSQWLLYRRQNVLSAPPRRKNT